MPKPLTLLRGRPLLEYALDAARASGCRPVLVVASDPRVGAAAGRLGVDVVYNDAPERGIASSLHCALRWFDPDPDVLAIVVGLADQPLIGSEAYRRIAAAYSRGARLAYATYAGVRANPVLVGREYWSEAMELTGDEGARLLFARHTAIEVPCDDTGTAADVDTRQDLAQLESRLTEMEK